MAKASVLDSYEHVHPLNRAEWRAWLTANGERSPGIWLVYYKKATGKPTLSYDEIVEEALCFGWVDSKPNLLDAERSKILVTPRKAKSVWSALNKRRVEKLSAAGLIAPAGQRLIDLAKQNGQWDALNDVEAMIIPDDLAKAFAKAKKAWAFFDGQPPSYKKGVLQWMSSAKRPETRAARVAEIVAQSNEGKRANQFVKKT